MSDSPSTSESFSREWYPAKGTLEAHQVAILAQARQHERGVLLAKHTHQRLTNIEAGVADIKATQAAIMLKLTQKEQSNAVLRTAIDAGKALLVALVTLAGAYLMRPSDPPPPSPPQPLSAQTLETIKLWEQRTGYTLGKRAPGEAAPPDPPKLDAHP